MKIVVEKVSFCEPIKMKLQKLPQPSFWELMKSYSNSFSYPISSEKLTFAEHTLGPAFHFLFSALPLSIWLPLGLSEALYRLFGEWKRKSGSQTLLQAGYTGSVVVVR